ncbi:MAG TPA: hypothetical protein VGW34_01595 [Allosphingosinicella sp.]|nr:hypothetical protein [Allosphingosinicella sp.]
MAVEILDGWIEPAKPARATGRYTSSDTLQFRDRLLAAGGNGSPAAALRYQS